MVHQKLHDAYQDLQELKYNLTKLDNELGYYENLNE
jgi:hypothetical protein